MMDEQKKEPEIAPDKGKSMVVKRYDRNVVVKSNELTGSYYKLNLTSQKLVCIFISLLNSKERQTQNFYRVSLRELVYLLDIDKSNDAQNIIVNAIRELNRNDMIYLGNKTWCSWLASFKIGMDGIVEFEFPEKLKPHLFELKHKFTAYRLGHIREMKTVKSIRVYELLKMHEKKGKWTVSIEELKKLLDINITAYPKWHDFKKRIVDPANLEIRTFTEIQFSYRQIKAKKSKKVEALEFTILPKDFDVDSWNDSLAKLQESMRNVRKKTYEAPNPDKVTERFLAVYRGFIESSHNFPDEYTFDSYLKDNGFKIKLTPNGKKDCEFQTILNI